MSKIITMFSVIVSLARSEEIVCMTTELVKKKEGINFLCLSGHQETKTRKLDATK